MLNSLDFFFYLRAFLFISKFLIWFYGIVIFTILVVLVYRYSLKKILSHLKITGKKNYLLILRKLRVPIYTGIFFYLLINLYQIFFERLGGYEINPTIINEIKKWLIVLTIFWVLFRILLLMEQHFSNNLGLLIGKVTSRTPTKASVYSSFKIAKIFLALVAFLILLDALGFSVSTLLTFGGLGTIVIGFAGKDILANVFSGFLILKDRPLSIGEWIKVDALKLEGTVQRIGWRITELVSFDQRPLYVPNSLLVNNIIENPQRMTHRRIYETIGLRYEDMPVFPTILNEIREALRANPEIADNKIQMVNFNEYSDSALNFFIYVMTKTIDWQHFHVVKESVLLQIANIIYKHGADFAYPTQKIYYQSESNNNNKQMKPPFESTN